MILNIDKDDLYWIRTTLIKYIKEEANLSQIIKCVKALSKTADLPKDASHLDSPDLKILRSFNKGDEK